MTSNSKSDAAIAMKTPADETLESFHAPPPPKDGRIIGVDCHPDTFTAAVFEGQTPHDARKLTSRENLSLSGLLAWAEAEFDARDLFLLEAGSNSFAVWEALRERGLRAVVLESQHVGKHAKTYADNDRMAAARIALVYLAGNAPAVWVPDTRTRERRELLHAYQRAVSGETAASNTLKGYLTSHAIRLQSRKLSSPKTRQWIEAQHSWSPLQIKLLEGYFADLEQAAQQRARYLQVVHEEIVKDPLMLRCMKLLGIGKINAFALLAIIGDVRRFERAEKLVAYLGLNPGQRDSGQGKRIKLGVGRRGRGDLRHLLMQGAHAVLRKGRATAMGQWGWKLFARKGHRNVAVAAVARKLVVQVWHLLQGNPPAALESDKSFMLKLRKLASALGTALRIELGLGKSLAACLQALLARTQATADHTS